MTMTDDYGWDDWLDGYWEDRLSGGGGYDDESDTTFMDDDPDMYDWEAE